jgi:hypothetical protein
MASNPGLSPAQAQRMATQQLATSNAATQNQMAQLRAQEQAQAEQAYAGMLSGARGQDIGLIGQQAGFEQQTNLANQQMQQQSNIFNAQQAYDAQLANQQMALQSGTTNAQLQMQQQQMNDQLTQYYLDQGMNLDQAQRQAQMTVRNNYMELEEARATRAANLANTIIGGEYGVSTTQMQADAQLTNSLVGGGMGALGALGAVALMSDETTKENVKQSDDETEAFLDALNNYSYNYKKDTPLAPDSETTYYGVMAQDAAKTDVGRSFVETGPTGKLMLNTVKGFGAVLNSLSNINKRLRAVES